MSPGRVRSTRFLGVSPLEVDLVELGGSARHQVIAGIPTGRFTMPEEVAALVVTLASPRTANVTDSNYVIDGGLVKTM